MTETLRDDVRATAEEVIGQAEQLIELEKRKIDAVEDGRPAEKLAEQADDLANDIARNTNVEKQLVEL